MYFDDLDFTYYKGNLLEEDHYYPYGLQINALHSIALPNNNPTRYGFNGQEKEDEIAGRSNITSAQFWQYDATLGRRWNVDPKPSAGISCYATFSNNPILFNDILGDTVNLKPSFQNNAKLMAGYNAWSKTKSGKKFLKDYGIGGKYESSSVNFSGGVGKQAFTNTSLVTSGGELDLNYGDIVENSGNIARGKVKGQYFKFDIVVSPGSDNLFSTLSHTKGHVISSFAEAYGHEKQHVDIIMNQLMAGKRILSEYEEHSLMMNSNGRYYKEREQLANELYPLWKSHQENMTGQFKTTKAGYIKRLTHTFRMRSSVWGGKTKVIKTKGGAHATFSPLSKD